MCRSSRMFVNSPKNADPKAESFVEFEISNSFAEPLTLKLYLSEFYPVS